MSKLDIITTLLALLFAPALVAGCWISYRRGVQHGKGLGHDEAGELWPHDHRDFDDGNGVAWFVREQDLPR